VLGNLTSGATYKFRVRAKNTFGFGNFSSILDIKAATWPEISSSVITSIDDITGGIIF
jgi:hypothetical protein